MQKRLSNKIIVYCPIIILVGQILANLLYLASPEVFSDNYYWIASLFGSNLVYGLAFTALTYRFEFCRVSRLAAIAQVIFPLIYIFVTKDEAYNTAVQIIGGVYVILFTVTNQVNSAPQWERQKS